MQRTAVGRIAKFWPDAEIQVLTDSPESLPAYGPNVQGVSSIGRVAWMSGIFPQRRVLRAPRRWERRIRERHVNLAESLAKARLRLLWPQKATALASFLGTCRNADLMVVCGMGGIADLFEEYALDLLDTIDLVKGNGKSVVAMFGQGFGPIGDHSDLAERAQEVLPNVDFIALREERASIPLLKRLNIDPSRVVVTGDDALEIAAVGRRSELGNNLGINLRVTYYSNVTTTHVVQLREIIQQFARPRAVELQPLPSSLLWWDADADSIAGLTAGYNLVRSDRVDQPEALTAQIQKCRIAVVGSYHAGVFALAQGIPIVGLYNSEYYRDKFLGLEALFGVGVFPVNLCAPEWTNDLVRNIDHAWESAPSSRLPLIEAADRLIHRGLKAYDDLRAMVEVRFGKNLNRQMVR